MLIAFAVLSLCGISMLALPSRKKMMLGETSHVPPSRTKMAYMAAITAFVFVAVLLIAIFMIPEHFQEVQGSLFVYSNMMLCVGIGAVLISEAHWVSNFSHELDETSTGSVTVLESPTLRINCPMCQQEIIIPHELQGHVIQCPSCGVEGRVGGAPHE